jgi:hypothetical protein
MISSLFQFPVFFLGARGLWRGQRSATRFIHFQTLTPHPDSKGIYVLLLVYAASTTTTVLPCLAVLLSMPVTTAATVAAKTASLSVAQRMLLLSSYVPFFLVPLVMTLDMARRLAGFVRSANNGAAAKKWR